MIKKTNVQRCIVISKELCDKIKKEAEENCASFNWVVKRVMTDYFRNKENI